MYIQLSFVSRDKCLICQEDTFFPSQIYQSYKLEKLYICTREIDNNMEILLFIWASTCENRILNLLPRTDEKVRNI